MHDETETGWWGPDAATFGDRVAHAREAAGMTQAQLARRLGVKKLTLIDWEQDVSEPRANKLSMMAGLLNVSLVWLLTGEGEGNPTPLEDDDQQRQDLHAVLAELREIRSEMRGLTERTARAEKRLRRLAEEEPAT